MNLKRFNDFLNEGMYVDAQDRLRTDSDEEEEFKHSPRSERVLMFIEDEYKSPNSDKEWFKNVLKDKYDIDIVTNDIYTELALAIRDKIIPEHDLEDLLIAIEAHSKKLA